MDNEIVIYNDDVIFSVLKKYPINTVFKIENPNKSFDTGIIAYYNTDQNSNILGLIIIRISPLSKTKLYYCMNPQFVKSNRLKIKIRESKSTIIAAQCYTRFFTSGRYDELLKNVKYSEIMNDEVGTIYSSKSSNPYANKRDIVEEIYVTTKFKNELGAIISYTHTKNKNNSVTDILESWIEWVDFPKDEKK